MHFLLIRNYMYVANYVCTYNCYIDNKYIIYNVTNDIITHYFGTTLYTFVHCT